MWYRRVLRAHSVEAGHGSDDYSLSVNTCVAVYPHAPNWQQSCEVLPWDVTLPLIGRFHESFLDYVACFSACFDPLRGEFPENTNCQARARERLPLARFDSKLSRY